VTVDQQVPRALEILKVIPKATGAKSQLSGRDSFSGTKAELPKTAPTLAQIGIDKKISARVQKMALHKNGSDLAPSVWIQEF
jgi:hypothetical protein